MRSSGASSKKLISRVRPGVLLVRASPWRPTIALMALDLPELERPAKATSAPRSAGNCPGAAALMRNLAFGNAATAVVYNPALSLHWQILGERANRWRKEHRWQSPPPHCHPSSGL